MCCCLVLQVSGKCRSSRNWASYSSSHKDWSCWAGLHPPSKADAVYAIPSRAPRLRVHQTGSRGGAEARRARAGLARSVRRGCTRRWKRALHVPPRGGTVGGTACRAPHTRRWKWAPRATRQTRTRVNVFENCYNAQSSSAPRREAHTGLYSQSPSAPRPVLYTGFNAQSSSAHTHLDPGSIPSQNRLHDGPILLFIHQ